MMRFALSLILLLGLSTLAAAGVRVASIDHAGNLVVQVTEPGPTQMGYQVQAEATATYQCLEVNYACPAVANRQQITATTLGQSTLKVVTLSTQVIAGLVNGVLTATPPLATGSCPDDVEFESSMTLMAVQYRSITVHNTTLGTQAAARPEAVSAVFHTCPAGE